MATPSHGERRWPARRRGQRWIAMALAAAMAGKIDSVGAAEPPEVGATDTAAIVLDTAATLAPPEAPDGSNEAIVDTGAVPDDHQGELCYPDEDGDGYGAFGADGVDCEDAPDAWVTEGDDCNDADPLAVHEGDRLCPAPPPP
jgi:hypothetical protein